MFPCKSFNEAFCRLTLVRLISCRLTLVKPTASSTHDNFSWNRNNKRKKWPVLYSAQLQSLSIEVSCSSLGGIGTNAEVIRKYDEVAIPCLSGSSQYRKSLWPVQSTGDILTLATSKESVIKKGWSFWTFCMHACAHSPIYKLVSGAHFNTLSLCDLQTRPRVAFGDKV